MLDRRDRMRVQTFIREHLSLVLGFFSNVLDRSDLPKECYLEALSAAKSWCHYSSDTFVPNQHFVQQILGLLQNPQYFSKAVNVIKKLLVVSKFTKALHNMSYEAAMKLEGSSPDDKLFLEQIVVQLQGLSSTF